MTRTHAVLSALLIALLVVACNETRGASADANPVSDAALDAVSDVATDVLATDTVATPDTAVTLDECVTDDDCTLYDDCCLCRALGGSQPPAGEACPDSPPCFQSACGAIGVTASQCLDGRCVLNAATCVGALCNMIPPTCPADRVPALDAAGTCWSGVCVRPTDCAALPCDQCASDDVCWDSDASGPHDRCFPRPEACGAQADCGCIGPAAAADCLGGCTLNDGQLYCLDGG